MITIIDYKLGNTGSIINMLKRSGHKAVVSSDPDVIAKAEKLILPGVGHFGVAMEQLEQRGLIDALNHKVLKEKTPILGICLGMQLMADFSEEGNCKGLSWINARIERFKLQVNSALKVPHMGWNDVQAKKQHPILTGLEQDSRFYFVHSYHAMCTDQDNVLLETTHGYPFTAAFTKENITGVQFHPEKSHRFGMTLLKNFAEKC